MPDRTCRLCHKGVLVPSTGTGRLLPWIGGVPRVVPDHVLIPTCTSCGEMALDRDATTAVLEAFTAEESNMTMVAYWFELPSRPVLGLVALDHVPIGIGVTGHDLADAMSILRGSEYARYVEGRGCVPIVEVTSPDDLPATVRERLIGPMIVRGLWYPVWRPATR